MNVYQLYRELKDHHDLRDLFRRYPKLTSDTKNMMVSKVCVDLKEYYQLLGQELRKILTAPHWIYPAGHHSFWGDMVDMVKLADTILPEHVDKLQYGEQLVETGNFVWIGLQPATLIRIADTMMSRVPVNNEPIRYSKDKKIKIQKVKRTSPLWLVTQVYPEQKESEMTEAVVSTQSTEPFKKLTKTERRLQKENTDQFYSRALGIIRTLEGPNANLTGLKNSVRYLRKDLKNLNLNLFGIREFLTKHGFPVTADGSYADICGQFFDGLEVKYHAQVEAKAEQEKKAVRHRYTVSMVKILTDLYNKFKERGVSLIPEMEDEFHTVLFNNLELHLNVDSFYKYFQYEFGVELTGVIEKEKSQFDHFINNLIDHLKAKMTARGPNIEDYAINNGLKPVETSVDKSMAMEVAQYNATAFHLELRTFLAGTIPVKQTPEGLQQAINGLDMLHACWSNTPLSMKALCEMYEIPYHREDVAMGPKEIIDVVRGIIIDAKITAETEIAVGDQTAVSFFRMLSKSGPYDDNTQCFIKDLNGMIVTIRDTVRDETWAKALALTVQVKMYTHQYFPFPIGKVKKLFARHGIDPKGRVKTYDQVVTVLKRLIKNSLVKEQRRKSDQLGIDLVSDIQVLMFDTVTGKVSHSEVEKILANLKETYKGPVLINEKMHRELLAMNNDDIGFTINMKVGDKVSDLFTFLGNHIQQPTRKEGGNNEVSEDMKRKYLVGRFPDPKPILVELDDGEKAAVERMVIAQPNLSSNLVMATSDGYWAIHKGYKFGPFLDPETAKNRIAIKEEIAYKQAMDIFMDYISTTTTRRPLLVGIGKLPNNRIKDALNQISPGMNLSGTDDPEILKTLLSKVIQLHRTRHELSILTKAKAENEPGTPREHHADEIGPDVGVMVEMMTADDHAFLAKQPARNFYASGEWIGDEVSLKDDKLRNVMFYNGVRATAPHGKKLLEVVNHKSLLVTMNNFLARHQSRLSQAKEQVEPVQPKKVEKPAEQPSVLDRPMKGLGGATLNDMVTTILGTAWGESAFEKLDQGRKPVPVRLQGETELTRNGLYGRAMPTGTDEEVMAAVETQNNRVYEAPIKILTGSSLLNDWLTGGLEKAGQGLMHTTMARMHCPVGVPVKLSEHHRELELQHQSGDAILVLQDRVDVYVIRNGMKARLEEEYSSVKAKETHIRHLAGIMDKMPDPFTVEEEVEEPATTTKEWATLPKEKLVDVTPLDPGSCDHHPVYCTCGLKALAEGYGLVELPNLYELAKRRKPLKDRIKEEGKKGRSFKILAPTMGGYQKVADIFIGVQRDVLNRATAGSTEKPAELNLVITKGRKSTETVELVTFEKDGSIYNRATPDDKGYAMMMDSPTGANLCWTSRGYVMYHNGWKVLLANASLGIEQAREIERHCKVIDEWVNKPTVEIKGVNLKSSKVPEVVHEIYKLVPEDDKYYGRSSAYVHGLIAMVDGETRLYYRDRYKKLEHPIGSKEQHEEIQKHMKVIDGIYPIGAGDWCTVCGANGY